MPEMATAFITHGLDPPHAETRIFQITNHLIGRRPDKRRPAGSGIELVSRIEQRFTTAFASIFPAPGIVIVVTAKRRLGTLFAAYPVLFRAQFATPFFIITH
jgi:hypothetical protein